MTQMDDNFDIEKAVREELARQSAANAPKNDPAPITVKLDGNDYTFATAEELSATLAAWREQTNAEIEKARLATTPAPTPKPAQQTSSGNDVPDWSNDKFIALMNEDPRKAFDYVDSYRYFDGTVDTPAKDIKARLDRADKIEKLLAVEAFRSAHPEFPVTDAQATAVVDKVREQLGLPFTAEGIEAAYFMATNKYPEFKQYLAQKTPTRPAQPQNEPPQNGTGGNEFNGFPNGRPSNPYLMAPPNINRNSDPNPPLDPLDYDRLSADQIKTILEKTFASKGR